jgi:putative membrane protein (TIGR04086 family)
MEHLMNVRWTAVLAGFLADYLISFFLSALATPEFLGSPDPARPGDLLLLVLLVLSTGIGGYIAGRIAQTDRTLNGLLVGVVGILLNQLGAPLPRVFVIASAVACAVAALGGFLSRYPPLRQPHSAS